MSKRSASTAIDIEGYIRVSSLAIGLYEYLLTLPTEYRMYRSEENLRRMSLGCSLFILIRYISIILMVVSNYGFLATFTDEACNRFFMVPPVFKGPMVLVPRTPVHSAIVFQTMISQAIMGLRTFNVAGRNKYIRNFLLAYYGLTVTLQAFFDFYHRSSLNVESTGIDTHGSCLSGDLSHPTAWVFYLVAMLYDCITLGITTFYLLRYRAYHGRLSHLISVMIYDGLIYFVALTAVNALNLAFYQQPNSVVQSTGASLGYVVVWIMSQRLLTHLRGAHIVVRNGTSHTLRLPACCSEL